jgi:hypothetical protein
MRFKFPSLLLFLIIFLINSCTLEKRRYSSGYYLSNSCNSKKIRLNQINNAIQEKRYNEYSTVKEDSIQLNSESIVKETTPLQNEVDEKSYDEIISQKTTKPEQCYVQSNNEMKVSNNPIGGIQNRNTKIENTQSNSLSTKRKMSTILKLAIIFTGLGIIALIVGFFSWYFYFLASVTGTIAAPLYPTLLTAGLISLAVGIFLFIAFWLFN